MKPSRCLSRLHLAPTKKFADLPARLKGQEPHLAQGDLVPGDLAQGRLAQGRLAQGRHKWANKPWTCQSLLHCTSQSELAVREFEPGEFEWAADAEQSGCVLVGKATLTLADGRQVQLHPGASFYLPRGMHGHWTVSQRLRAVVVSNAA